MALLGKYILVRKTSGADQDFVKQFTENWLSGFDTNEPENEFFAFIIDKKHDETLLAFSPKARSVYQIEDEDNFTPLVDIESIPQTGGLSEQEVLNLVQQQNENLDLSSLAESDVLSIVQQQLNSEYNEDLIKSIVEPIRQELIAYINDLLLTSR